MQMEDQMGLLTLDQMDRKISNIKGAWITVDYEFVSRE